MKGKKRTDREILDDLVKEVMEYNFNRDCEWEFADEHGTDDSFWSEEDVDEHQRILDAIMDGRTRVAALLREATGDEALDF